MDYAEFVHYAFVVKDKKNENYMILGECGLLKAVRAAGCLLEPEPGDLVLAAVSVNSAYITSVLERKAADKNARLKLPGRTTISAENELILYADDLHAAGVRCASIHAADLSVVTIKGRAQFDKFTLTGRQLNAKLARLKSLVGSIDATADRMLQRLTRSYRRIRDFEDSRIGRWRCVVQELFSVHARDSHLISDKRTKIDAEKISLG